MGQYDNHPLPTLSSNAVDLREDQSAEQTAAEVTTKIQALQDALRAAQLDIEEKESRIRECEAKVKTTEDYTREQEKLVKYHENQEMKILKDVNKVKDQCDKLRAERDKLFQEKGILRKEKDEVEASGQRKEREVAEYKRIIARFSGNNHLSDDQLRSKFDALFNSLQACVFKSFRSQGQTFSKSYAPNRSRACCLTTIY
jgi:chromosome segregation ATPase